jgi:2-haloacid dehalogenase
MSTKHSSILEQWSQPSSVFRRQERHAPLVRELDHVLRGLTVAGCYVPFTDIGAAVMKMLADTQHIKIDDADKRELTEKFSTMPPHPEVPAALRRLRDAGFRLFTLTDNLLEVQTRQLEHGGIVDLFERRFSADGVKHHKPSPQAYGYVEKELGVKPTQLCLIACHTWDTLGAVKAGWEAALIADRQ